MPPKKTQTPADADLIQMTIRLPRELWKRIRRAQEDGLCESFQKTSVTALEEHLTKLEKHRKE